MIQDQISAKKTNKSSEGMFEAKKNKKFNDIFKALDKNGNGLISADEIDIDRINPSLLTIINELLIEMEEKGKTLDCSAFCIGMSKFYEYLTPSEKQSLLNVKTLNEDVKKDDKSKPLINQISKVLAENLKKTDGLSNIKKKWEERKAK